MKQNVACEALDRRGRKCKNNARFRANGMAVCGVHKRRIDRRFAAAEKRWKDAAEPESNL